MNNLPVYDQHLLERICQTLYDKKGFNIMALDVRNLSTLTDYFIIAEGNVEKHVQTLAKYLEGVLSEEGRKPLHVEGIREGDWVVLDFSDVVIHLLTPDMRERYSLEHLWQEAKIIDVPIHVEHASR